MRRRTHARRWSASVATVGAVVALGTFGVAGCASNPQPTVLTGPTAAPSSHPATSSPKPHASHSPTPTPTHTRARRGHDDADRDHGSGKSSGTNESHSKKTHQPSKADIRAGQRALSDFFAAVNKANKSGDVKPLKPLWQASCIWCGTYVNAIDQASFAGWKHVGGHVDTPKITFGKRGRQGQLVYRVTLTVSQMKIVDDKGKTREQEPAVHDQVYSFSVTRSGSTWQVAQGQTGEIK